ncbi:MAG: LysM peptidoglycan-binding domain-containing protein [Lentisphaeria bacterium]|nr:LysM peptidoglycan-binding domain-containing protein [Lentisphaeria bacterium]NQZ68267.1 LysM peptidoglycan-binding domain-containing protein [Lentisphaeria bacterium]
MSLVLILFSACGTSPVVSNVNIRKSVPRPHGRIDNNKAAQPQSKTKIPKKESKKLEDSIPLPIIDDNRLSSKKPSDKNGFVIVGDTKSLSKRSYTTKKGDTMSKIARKFYGDTDAWEKIYEKNKSVISDPDDLPVGITLDLP